MKLIKMTVPHNPPLSYGNCHQCCLAMMLNFSLDWVPHFCDANLFDEETWEKHQRDWLRGFGKVLLTFPYPGELRQGDIMDSLEYFNPGIPYIFGGNTVNGGHSVVVCKRAVLNPGEFELIGPMDTGMYYASYLGVV